MNPLFDSVGIEFRQRTPNQNGPCDIVVSVAHLTELTFAIQLANAMIDLLMTHNAVYAPSRASYHLPAGATPDGQISPNYGLVADAYLYNEVLAIGMAFGALNPNQWLINYEEVTVSVQCRYAPGAIQSYNVGVNNGITMATTHFDGQPQNYVISPS